MKGRSYLVTGASSGLGRATAVALAARGACVGVGTFADDPHDAEETVRLARSAGGRALAVTADVRDSSQLDEACRLLARETGRLDGVVANAGWLKRAPLASLTDEVWHQVVDVDLTGVMRTVRAALPFLPDGGAVVCISSIAGGAAGWADHTPYTSAKAGVLGFVRSAALEAGAPWHPRERRTARGHQVTAVARPGQLRRSRWARPVPGADPAGPRG